MTFDDLNLLPGNALQLQFKFTSNIREKSTLIGYRTRRSILVTTPEVNGAARPVKVGEELNVRLFSATTNAAAAFTSKVSHVSVAPYPHLHLTYPESVSTDEVRQATRVSTTLKADVNINDKHIVATIVDLSTSGCRIESDEPLGEVNTTFTLMTKIEVASTSRIFPLKAEIKTIISKETNANRHVYGLAFIDMPEEVALVLHAYVYYQLRK